MDFLGWVWYVGAVKVWHLVAIVLAVYALVRPLNARKYVLAALVFVWPLFW